MEQWEYLTVFLRADASMHEEYLRRTMRMETPPKFAPQALIPELNQLGHQGWELMHIEPVVVGANQDVAVGTTEGTAVRPWTNTYFCVFKRRKEF